VETHDDEGHIALVSEKQMCEILGMTEEETHVDEGQMNEQGVDNEQCVDNEQGVDTEGVAIPTSDAIPSEMVISYDKNNPQWISVQYTQQQRSSGWLCDNLLSIRSLI
jgi:hypothetical protein